MSRKDDPQNTQNIYRVSRKAKSTVNSEKEPWGAILIARSKQDARRALEAHKHGMLLLQYDDDLVWEYTGVTTRDFSRSVVMFYDVQFNVYEP